MRNPGSTALGAQYAFMQHDLATLVAGTATITSLMVDQNSAVIPQRVTAGGTLGLLAEAAVTPGSPTGSFIVNSSNALDTSAVRCYLLQGRQSASQKYGGGNGPGGSNLGQSGHGIQITTATLVAGTVTVTAASLGVASTSFLRIIARHKTRAGTPGQLSWAVAGGGTGITITSTNALDTSVVTIVALDVAALSQNSAFGTTGYGAAFPALQASRITLVAGAGTALALQLPSNSKSGMFLQCFTPGGTPGNLTIGTVTPGASGSVGITSDDAGDTSTVEVFCFNQALFGR